MSFGWACSSLSIAYSPGRNDARRAGSLARRTEQRRIKAKTMPGADWRPNRCRPTRLCHFWGRHGRCARPPPPSTKERIEQAGQAQAAWPLLSDYPCHRPKSATSKPDRHRRHGRCYLTTLAIDQRAHRASRTSGGMAVVVRPPSPSIHPRNPEPNFIHSQGCHRRTHCCGLNPLSMSPMPCAGVVSAQAPDPRWAYSLGQGFNCIRQRKAIGDD